MPRALILCCCVLLLAACAPAAAATQPPASPPPAPSAAPDDPPRTPAPTLTPRPSRTPPVEPSAAPSPSPTATPNPLAPWTIDALAARQYGEGDILVAEVLPGDLPVQQYVVEYPSDGLRVTGLLWVPYGEGPFPVILVLHGYIDPAVYYRGLDSRALGDSYAVAGYAVLMPDYRGYAGGPGSPNPLRIPYVIDVLNAIESLDTLDVLDEDRVGVVGHSMGGGIATYLMVLSDRVDAVALYGSMNADQAVNWQWIGQRWSPWWMQQTAAEIGSPLSNPDGYARVSPINYLDRVSMPVQIHHGTLDDQVPVEWSRQLAGGLAEAGKQVEYFEYPDSNHTFYTTDRLQLIERTLAFFDRYVRGEG